MKTYPTTEHYELEKALTSPGTGEAIVTVLSELHGKYAETIDRESAYEKLAAKMAPAPEAPAQQEAPVRRTSPACWRRCCPAHR